MRFWLVLLLVPALLFGVSALVDRGSAHGWEGASAPEEGEQAEDEEHEKKHVVHEPIDHVMDSSLDTTLVEETKTTTPPLKKDGNLFTDGSIRFQKKGIPVGAVIYIERSQYGLEVGGEEVHLPFDLTITRIVSESEVEVDPVFSADPGNLTYTIKRKHFLSGLGVTKHVLMLWIAGALTCLMGFSVGRSAKEVVPTGLRNFIEAILLFLRDEVAKPQLGHNTDKYMPFLWTFFFFILFCNLLGLVPGAATATGNINVTAALALAAFTFYHLAGIHEQGLGMYLKNIVPGGIPLWLYPLMLVVEIIGHLAKPFALAVRLFANMIAGHIVMAVILGFAAVSLFVAPISVAGGVFMYFLETFVAFLQAFIFTFLMTVFLGMAVHPEH